MCTCMYMYIWHMHQMTSLLKGSPRGYHHPCCSKESLLSDFMEIGCSVLSLTVHYLLGYLKRLMKTRFLPKELGIGSLFYCICYLIFGKWLLTSSLQVVSRDFWMIENIVPLIKSLDLAVWKIEFTVKKFGTVARILVWVFKEAWVVCQQLKPAFVGQFSHL